MGARVREVPQSPSFLPTEQVEEPATLPFPPAGESTEPTSMTSVPPIIGEAAELAPMDKNGSWKASMEEQKKKGEYIEEEVKEDVEDYEAEVEEEVEEYEEEKKE